MATVNFEQFEAIEMRVGRILRAERNEKARNPAYKLWIDFGEEIGVKQSSAQIVDLYSPEELAGRLVVAVTNFPPKMVAGWVSEVLVLGVPDDERRVCLLSVDGSPSLGARVF